MSSLSPTVTATVVSASKVVPPVTVAVTVMVAAVAAFSATVDGFTESAMPVGAPSLSSMVMLAGDTVTPDSPVTLPSMVRLSASSSMVSSVGVSVKVALPDAEFAWMVMLTAPTSV